MNIRVPIVAAVIPLGSWMLSAQTAGAPQASQDRAPSPLCGQQQRAQSSRFEPHNGLTTGGLHNPDRFAELRGIDRDIRQYVG